MLPSVKGGMDEEGAGGDFIVGGGAPNKLVPGVVGAPNGLEAAVGTAGAVWARWKSGFDGVVVPALPVPKILGAEAVPAGVPKLNENGPSWPSVTGEPDGGPRTGDFGLGTEVGGPMVESNGGVFGRLLLIVGDSAVGSSFFLSASLSSFGKTPKTGLGETGVGSAIAGGDFGFSSSSSSADTALANGELRAGFVLGLPSPRLKGEEDGAPGVPGPNKGFCSFTGVLGGVVLGSRTGEALGDGDDDSSFPLSAFSLSAEGETSMVGTSG